MKVSINWLKDFVDVDVDIETLSNLFTLHSAEIEETTKLINATNLKVGFVTDIKKHENADTLNVCQVKTNEGTHQIICGAPNVQENQHVIVAMPGAVLPGNFKIKKAKIRGVESNGMICSLNELGVDKSLVDASGIHVIKEACTLYDNPLEVLNLDDEVMTVHVNPNRPDLLSIMGVAIDTAAILDKEYHPKSYTVNEIKEENPIDITLNTPYCPSYYTRVVKDVVIRESPRFIKSRLIAAGMRPINNIVDITNYVMLETGQPLHAFDLDSLEKEEITVRLAKDNESFKTLDNKERLLKEDDIVITSNDIPIALGGVMGGADSEITDQTSRIIIESAIFDEVHIRNTQKRLDLRSEASTRFERGIDPNRTKLALDMCASLFEKYADAKTLKNIKKVDNIKPQSTEISVSLEKINKTLGTSYTKKDITQTLDKLFFNYTTNKTTFNIIPPSHRLQIETYQDIIEEVGRMLGYKNIPSSLPETVSVGRLSSYQIFKRNIKHHMTSLGLNEVKTYALIKDERVHEFDKDSQRTIQVNRPMSQEHKTLTLSPLPNLIDVVKYNKARKLSDVFIFELGKNYQKDNEIELLSGTLTGTYDSVDWQSSNKTIDFYLVKGLLESLFEKLNLNQITYHPTNAYKNCHPGQTALIKQGDDTLGFIGKIHPKYAQTHKLEDTFVFELDLKEMYNNKTAITQFNEISKYPSITRDIALVVDDKVLASELLESIKKASNKTLKTATVFDVYHGEPLAETQKSLAIKLTFGLKDRTLETQEIEEQVALILQAVKRKYDAELRSI
ncbi:MAG: phenylalanine--tRNA ligase subunit beta [Candidatus Izimaplasma sp.]|nr:phenylalanine--tRNA ligase subunit beta [Candidatus Izimaplasma bacterium]